MTRKTCATCGAAIAADHPHGLCPACLLNEGLTSETLHRDGRRQCTKCQSALGDDARFCAHCGAPAALLTADGDPIRTALETKLQGQYRIIRLLGRGGMGAVYLARDLTLEREVAVKVVKTSSESAEMYDRFRREAKTAARLSHPNIVPLHAFGEVEGMPYFVMGYVRGESLAARLHRDGKMSEEDGSRVLAEIADALDHAHRQGVVHRDIKPDNVLLEDESGRAVLTDFGVAKALGRGETMTMSGSVIGTPHYMSPEQAAGRGDVDGRSDIYSLGVMAYAILSGRLPFEGATPADVLTKHLTQEPPSLRSLAPNVSDSTAQVVERCLAKDPSKRWPDARSLKLALGASDESQLPDALHALEGRGVLGLIVAFIWLLVILMADVPTAVKVTHAALIAFIYFFVVNGPRKEGISIAQAQTALWREPSWWLWWYPRRLRRRGNVWERLPASVRSLRAWPPIIGMLPWIFFPLCVVTSTFPNYARHPRFFMATMAGVVAIVATSVFFIARARRELKRSGLSDADAQRVMFSVPVSRASFWSRPHIAAVLAPAARADRVARSDSPHDQLQSILVHANELSGPLRPLGAEAASSARQLVASIDDADREIAELTRSLEPGEEQRLAEKIAALAGRDDSKPLHSLLEKQLELIRGLSERIEEVKETRNRRVEMLRSLSLHLASLRARSSESVGDVHSLSDRVRSLCDDIAGQTAANRP